MTFSASALPGAWPVTSLRAVCLVRGISLQIGAVATAYNVFFFIDADMKIHTYIYKNQMDLFLSYTVSFLPLSFRYLVL